MTTHVLMIVDMSGSMHGYEEDVRGGFNSYLEALDPNTDYSFTVTVFDTEFISLSTATSLAETPRLNSENYSPRGMTALLDAVGKTVTDFEAKKVFQEGDRVLVVVQTDGFENSSSEFSKERIADMIAEREKTKNWSFTFLGAGPNTWKQAGMMGFQRANTVSYGREATRSAYAGMSKGTTRFASGQSVDVFAADVATASGGIVHGEGEDDSRDTGKSS